MGIRSKFKLAREQIQNTIKMFKINCLIIAMLVTMTSSATSFLRALDQNINRVPTIYEMDDLFDKDTEMALSNCLGDSTLLETMVDPSIMKMICFQVIEDFVKRLENIV